MRCERVAELLPLSCHFQQLLLLGDAVTVSRRYERTVSVIELYTAMSRDGKPS